MNKDRKYLQICTDICDNIGGKDNIVGVAHCATRLRIVLKDNSLINIDELEKINKVKGAFIAGDQLQLIFGAGLVNSVYEDFSSYTNITDMSLSDLKTKSTKKGNIFQSVIKALSDVFIGILPAILAAALLMGITGVLANVDLVKQNSTLYAINRLVSLSATGIFNVLPMVVCYSAVKRFGGNPVLGIVVGSIMLDASLANAYQAAQGSVTPEVISLFGLNIEMVGFQGGIIIALMMGYIVAKLDIYFNKKIPDVIKLLVAPLLTVFISTLLLFTIVGPIGRILSSGITNGLVLGTNNLGVFGYALFAGVQQLIVITGLHHIISAVEAQLLADTGVNFLNPLMSVALFGQGGAVLGYLAMHWKDAKAKEICIPSFCSTLLGISEPAIFGVNLRHRYPLIGGCIGGACAGAYVYFTKLTALGFGTTGIPGLAIANSQNNGYINYIIAHIIALGIGAGATIALGILKKDKKNLKIDNKSIENQNICDSEKANQNISESEKVQEKEHQNIILKVPVQGEILPVSESSDSTFAQKVMGDGIIVKPTNGIVKSPCDGTISFAYPTGHAIGIELQDGTAILIHCGIDTVNLNGEGFKLKVKQGDTVVQGQELIQFDKDFIEEKGYSSEVIMIACDLDESRTIKLSDTDKDIAFIIN